MDTNGVSKRCLRRHLAADMSAFRQMAFTAIQKALWSSPLATCEKLWAILK